MRQDFSIPSLHADARFVWPLLGELVRPASAIEHARSLVRAPMVVITGPTGVGKSTLAAAMLHEMPGGIWYRWARDDFWTMSEEERALWQDLWMRAPGLVIDDFERLGGMADGPSSYEEDRARYVDRFGDTFETVLRGRLLAERPTIITTLVDEVEIGRSHSVVLARWVFGGARIELEDRRHPVERG